jgi:hypothetical protein
MARAAASSRNLNRTQFLVLGLLLIAWIGAVPLASVNAITAVVVLAASAFLALLSVGTYRRWRWTFWLVLFIGFLNVLSVPASIADAGEILKLAGLLAGQGVSWASMLPEVLPALLRDFSNLAAIGVSIAMLVGYRRAGVWAAF